MINIVNMRSCWKSRFQHSCVSARLIDGCVDQGVGQDQFSWMSHDQLCILVYLITVMHSMQVNWGPSVIGIYIYIHTVK